MNNEKFLGHTNYWMSTCNKFYIPGEPLEDLEDGDRVHVYSWNARNFVKEFKFPKKLHLVSAMGDAPLNAVLDEQELFHVLDTESNCLSWTMTNSFYSEHPKLKLVNNYMTINTHKYLLENAKRLAEKPKKDAVYYNYTIVNQYERLLTPNEPPKPFEEYIEEMAEYKYAYCPNGVGLDISKFYEAVACGVIPMVKVPKKYARVYDKYNFVCIPGYSAVSYIMDCKELLDLQESPYIPEKPSVKNSIDLLYESEPPRSSPDKVQEVIDKINSFEVYKHVFKIVPNNNLNAHVQYLVDTGKLKR